MSSDQITTNPASPGPRRCPHCGATLHTPSATRCWLCEAPITPQQTGEPDETLQLIQRPEASDTMSAGVFVALMLTSVAVGLLFIAPGLLIVFVLIGTPILLRFILPGGFDAPPRAGTVVGRILTTLGIIIMIGVAAAAAFFATCFVVCLGGLGVTSLTQSATWQWIPYVSIGCGTMIGLYVVYRLVLHFRSRKG